MLFGRDVRRVVAIVLMLANGGCARVLDSASLCVVVGCRTVSILPHALLSPSPWDESRGSCDRTSGADWQPEFVEVVEKWRPVAIALLADDEFLEISIEKARELTGQEFGSEGIVVLSRALKDSELHVSLDSSSCLQITSINGSCWDLAPVAPRHVPIVLGLRELPARLQLRILEDCF